MKKFTLILLATIVLATTTSFAKTIRTVVFNVPQMECESCEAKVKKNIKNVKGLKSFKIDLPQKTIAITYDSDKTSVKKLQEAFKKFNYDANVLKSPCAEGDDAANCTNANNKATKSCCKATGTCDKTTKNCDKTANSTKK